MILQELLIKHYPGGIMTDHIFNLKTGEELQFKGKHLFLSAAWRVTISRVPVWILPCNHSQ
jgi:hypothetical protein